MGFSGYNLFLGILVLFAVAVILIAVALLWKRSKLAKDEDVANKRKKQVEKLLKIQKRLASGSDAERHLNTLGLAEAKSRKVVIRECSKRLLAARSQKPLTAQEVSAQQRKIADILAAKAFFLKKFHTDDVLNRKVIQVTGPEQRSAPKPEPSASESLDQHDPFYLDPFD